MRTFTFLGIQEFAEKAKQLIYDGLALVNEALENSIGTTLVEMVIQLCCTLVIFLIVRFLIWNKVTEILEKRKQVVRERMKADSEAQIKKEIVDVAYLMASKIVEKEIEKDKYDLPLEEFIQESKKDK